MLLAQAQVVGIFLGELRGFNLRVVCRPVSMNFCIRREVRVRFTLNIPSTLIGRSVGVTS